MTSTYYCVAHVQNLLSHSATSANAKQLHLDYYEFAATAHAGTDASTNLTHVPFSVLFPPVYTCSEVKNPFPWEEPDRYYCTY